MNVHNDLVNACQAPAGRSDGGMSMIGVLASGRMSSIIPFSGTLGCGWTRIATGQLWLSYVVVLRAITLGRGRRA